MDGANALSTTELKGVCCMKLRTHDPGHAGHIAFAIGHISPAVVETATALADAGHLDSAS